MSADNFFTWLKANGYTDVADQISAKKQKWADQGVKTRRNWWEVLAGDKNGNPRIIDGEEFPVLAAAQKRQGKPITENALKRNDSEEAPPIKENTRWTKRNKEQDADAAESQPEEPQQVQEQPDQPQSDFS